MTQTPSLHGIDSQNVNLPLSLDSPTREESLDMSPLIEQHQPGPIELAWEPREEEAGPSSKGVGSDPALPVSAVGLVQCFGSPRQRPLGPGRPSASCTSSNGLLMAEQASQSDSALLEVPGKVGSEEKPSSS